jgi:hypothetical protein
MGQHERKNVSMITTDGRREVEGVTPKALPAPATPDASGT